MTRRIRYKRWLVAGLGVAALVAPTSALAGNHNMSPQAYRALVAKGQAQNQRYAIFAQGQALDDRYGNLTYGAPDGWTPYVVSLTTQSRIPVLTDGRSPDTVDYAVQAHNPFTVSSGSTSRFQWGDFGIGGGVALGAVLLLLLSLLLIRQGRDEQTPIVGT